MSAIIRGEADMVAATQLAPTLYIQAPILETNDDPQILRNSGSLRGAKAVVDEAI